MTTATPARPDLTVDIKKTTPSKMRTVAKKNMEAFLRNKCAGETIMYSKDGDGYTAARMHRYNGIACGHGPTPYAALGEALALLIPEGLSTDAHMCSIKAIVPGTYINAPTIFSL